MFLGSLQKTESRCRVFDQSHYVPILKGRDGEYGALKELQISARSKLTPLIEIPPVPWDFKKKAPQKSLDSHVHNVADKLFKSWGTRFPIFLDTLWLGGAAKMVDGSHVLAHILQICRLLRLKVVPVTGFMRESEHLSICMDAHREDKLGICVRLLRADLDSSSAAIASDLRELLSQIDVMPCEVDLLIDFRDISSDKTVDTFGAMELIKKIPSLSEWRSFTVCGSSFPSTLANIPPDACSHIKRLEWELWKDLRLKLPEGSRVPTFSDYAIAHPEHSEVDPSVMKASAAIRYTTPDSWMVVKGRGLGKYKYDQFHDLSKKLTRRAEYRGGNFSWGDEYIEGCGYRIFGTGNLTKWRQVGTSHHIALVLEQIGGFSAS